MSITIIPTYKPRIVRFKEIVKMNGWTVKVYTIVKSGEFQHHDFYQNVLQQLPEWTKRKNGLNEEHFHTAFLILHVGTEGIFTIFNWWLGGYMMNTQIYLSEYDTLDEFTLVSGKGIAPCVWELEIINHERVAWTCDEGNQT